MTPRARPTSGGGALNPGLPTGLGEPQAEQAGLLPGEAGEDTRAYGPPQTAELGAGGRVAR